MFGVIWGLAFFGIVLDSLPRVGPRILPVAIYLIMGWLAMIALQPLLEALPMSGVTWLVAGGLFFTAGLVFYAMDSKYRHAHGIWHVFVLSGTATHYFTILFYVA